MARLLIIITLLAAAAPVAAQPLPPVPVPPENPITEAKRVLGKLLFWDTQLSSDNTIACGTCHITGFGGTDPRHDLHPGADGILGTADDAIGSPGVIRADASGEYILDASFGLRTQVTRRAANPMLMAQFAPEVFWDGRAGGTFIDPETGETAIRSGGALETQAIAPIVSDVEMAHEDRDWSVVAAKLAAVYPMALATELPPDMAEAIAGVVTYPDLFADAFGGDAITARRIAFALATYERTLLPDQTRFDLGQLSPTQQAGFEAFMQPEARCTTCHPPPLFTDFSFRNIGLRPPDEDPGRFEVTADPEDRGRFKVPSLRNVGLKETLMHHGLLNTMGDAIDFYTGVGKPQFRDNQDEAIPGIVISPRDRANIADFLRNGLIDLRVVNEQFPFDRPRLHTELPSNPAATSFGTAGTGNIVPTMIATTPPNLGHDGFKIGVRDALGGVNASVALSRTPPLPDGTLDAFAVQGPVTLGGRGGGNGYGTWSWPLPDDDALLGDQVYLQWLVEDPAAADGIARTAVAHLRFYRDDPTQCGCHGDLDCDDAVDAPDLDAVLLQWGACDLCNGDLNDDGEVNVEDLVAVILAWGLCN